METQEPADPRVVIIGAGFGGLEAAKHLGNKPVCVTVIDRTNYHLFQPLLYQVATAALSPADIAAPVRGILGKYENIEVILAKYRRSTSKSTLCARRSGRFTTIISSSRPVRATPISATTNGRSSRRFEEPQDAVEIRRRILMAFEFAAKPRIPKRGGGDEFCRDRRRSDWRPKWPGRLPRSRGKTLAKISAHRSVDCTRDSGGGDKRVLSAFPEDLSASALEQLKELGVEVMMGTHAENLTENGLEVAGKFIPCRVKIWAAGNTASYVGKTLGVPVDRAGRVIVQDDLTIPGHPRYR